MLSNDYTRCIAIEAGECPLASVCKRMQDVQIKGEMYSFSYFNPMIHADGTCHCDGFIKDDSCSRSEKI